METRGDRFNHLCSAHEWEKVEFPTLAHFIEEVRDSGINTVRVDVFCERKVSELSFIYYLTTTLFVTALFKEDAVLYEYSEWLSTGASNGEDVNASLTQPAQARLSCVRRQLREASFLVRRGRSSQPVYRPN